MIPRQDYPRPILKREFWLNLNGEWEFGEDPDDLGLKEHWFRSADWPKKIMVPFAPGSIAANVDFSICDIIWYQREFELPTWQADRVILHIGASDHVTRVFINGLEVGQHTGGYGPITLDVSHALTAGKNVITIRVSDSDSWMQPRGKQAGTTRWPIDYDAVIGIWQTVWLEPVNTCHIVGTHADFRLDSRTLIYTVTLSVPSNGSLEFELMTQEGKQIFHCQSCGNRSEVRLNLSLDREDIRLWSPDDPYCYEVQLRLVSEAPAKNQGDTLTKSVLDSVLSYLGLRQVNIESGLLKLNGEPVYLRGILDQGYFQQGWYTAISDEEIRKDVELTLGMGFNFARKHQKAEDPRYQYWCDKLGLLLWSEMPSGRIFSTQLVTQLTTEWMSLIQRDRANPCVIGWVPFNESWGVWHLASRQAQRAFVDAMVNLTRSLDTTRPIIGNDGWEYTSGDLWTLHVYEEGEGRLSDRIAALIEDPGAEVTGGDRPRVGALPGSSVSGLPILLTECGGVGFLPEDYEGESFSYGELPGSLEALEQQLREIADKVDAAKHLQGFVWTQLTDIQQEINGLLYFDRSPKLPIKTLHDIFSKLGASNI